MTDNTTRARGAPEPLVKRRSRGDGGLHWDERRQRWIATASLGYDPAGRRIVRRGSGRTKTEAKRRLREVLRDHDDGLAIAPSDYTVADSVRDWLTYGLTGREDETAKANRILADKHIQAHRPAAGGAPAAGLVRR